MIAKATTNATDVLRIENLHVDYVVRGRRLAVLRGLDLTIRKGEAYGLVGESGCGKSTAALAAVRYLPRNGVVNAGRVMLNGTDVLRADAATLQELRQHAVSMVYQDPGRALNPAIKVGRLLSEVFEVTGIDRREAKERALSMLERVQIAMPSRVMDAYPHQLSGGMQQRVIIAMALAKEPSLLVLDEPTTGLDATVEAGVIDLIAHLRQEFGTSVLFISHNLAVVARLCDRVGVLYAGTLVEEGPARDVLDSPHHPYTVGLLRCLPRAGFRKGRNRLETIQGFLPPIGAALPGCVFADRCALADERCRTRPPEMVCTDATTIGADADRRSRCYYVERAASMLMNPPVPGPAATQFDRSGPPVLRALNLSKTFVAGGHRVNALDDVSFDLWSGETLGLVGESGSGKSTLAKSMVGLSSFDDGSELQLRGALLSCPTRKRRRDQIKAVQMVFQNPASALNRSHSVHCMVGRALGRLAGLKGSARERRFTELAEGVRLGERHFFARPSQLSGGLKQRVAIARAFAGNPDLVVCDEPTSALDVSVQAAILNLLVELQAERRVSYLFISHDLNVVRYLSDRIAVMYRGTLVQIGPSEALFSEYQHPYTEMLLAAMPNIEDKDRSCGGSRTTAESRANVPPTSGCIFQAVCPRKLGEVCETVRPPERVAGDYHTILCHLPLEKLRTRPYAVDVHPELTSLGS